MINSHAKSLENYQNIISELSKPRSNIQTIIKRSRDPVRWQNENLDSRLLLNLNAGGTDHLMKTILALQCADRFATRLKNLREVRRKKKRKSKRKSLTKEQREAVKEKTGGRCHICGGKFKRGEKWHANHVFAHAHGGEDREDNYLPAHALCNNFRWHYGAEEFQWILKLGVWARTRIEKKQNLSADQFVKSQNVSQKRKNKKSKMGD